MRKKKNKLNWKRKSSAKRKVVLTLASLFLIGLVLMGGYLFLNNSSVTEYTDGNTFSNWLTGATVGIEEIGLEDIIIQAEATSTTCGTISANLTLTANISATITCFTINANNVALDCNGYGVKGDGGVADYAVTNTGGYDNITIQDCSFVTWGNGIRLATSASLNDYLYNNTFLDATLGIYLDVSSQAIILNNTFKSSSDTDGIYFNNGDNSNVTNNTFEGDYSESGVYFNGVASSGNNVWQNKFLAADGVTDGGTNTNFCVDNTMGNFYNGSVAIAQIQADDCGPTPNGTVNVNQSLGANIFSWAGGDANYTDLRTGVYNLYNAAGKNTVYLKENHNTSYSQSLNAVETVRNDIAINCMGYQYGDSSATTSLNGIVINAENGIKIYNCTINNFDIGIYITANGRMTIYNNTFISNGEQDAIYFNNGDNSNVTNNTFEGDYSEAGIFFNGVNSANNNVWQNKFFAADGVTDSGTNTNFCVDNTMGNFYNGSVAIAQIQADDCGPTPNGTVNVNQSLSAQQFSWAGGDANYTDLRTGVYNLYNAAGKNTVYLKENHNTSYSQSTNAVETVRNDININCMGYQYGDSSATTSLNGIVINAENGIKVYNCTINNFNIGIYITADGRMEIYNNTFISNGEQDAIYFNNGDNSNVTNNTFEGDYSEAGIFFNGVNSANNNVWQNKFQAADGISGSGTNLNFCVDNTMGNFYNGSVAVADVPAADCGPTPNGTVNVNQSLGANIFSWAGGDANYTDLRTGVYNLYNAAGKNTVYLKENHNTSYSQSLNAVETVRNNININCMGYQYGDSSATTSLNGIVINAENGIKIYNCTINNFELGIYLNGNGVAAIYNNTFIAGGEQDAIYFNNGDNSNVTNNTFEGDYSEAGIFFNGVASSGNNVWQNKFLATEGVTDGGTGNIFCVGGTSGNFYNSSVALAQVLSYDCGPTPNSSVYVNQSLSPASWTFSSSPTANPTYSDLQEAYYNIGRFQTIYLQQNYSKTSLTQTIRNDTTLDCLGYGISTSSVALKMTGAHWNKVRNCNIRTTGTSNHGINILTSVGNEIINSVFNASGATAYGIHFQTNANHNNVINTTFLGSAANDVFSTSSTNNTLINTSFARGDFGFSGTANILVKWYVNVNVTDGTNPLNLANVGIYNNTAGLLYSGTTDTSGTTGKQILQEFIQSAATTYVYSTPHNVTGNLTGYNSNNVMVNLTQTNSTTVNLVLTSGNVAPNIISVILNATSTNNYTTDNLTCYANITDADGGNVYANYTWYKNNITNISGQSGPYASGTLNLVANLTDGNTTKNEQWICSVMAYDGTAYEADWNNASIVIQNTPPTTSLLDLPANNTNTSDNTPFFNWSTATDADGDAITYRIEIANDSAFTQYAQINTSIPFYSNYTALTLGDKAYYWRVEANTSDANSSWSEWRTIMVDTVTPIVSWINPTNYSNYTKNTFNITFNASVLDSSAQSVLFSFDNASGTNFNITAINGSGSWTAQYNVSSLAEGSHTVTVIANDSTGNINNLQTIIFTVDNTAPRVTWIAPANNSNYSATAYNQTFNLSIFDENFVNIVLLSFNNATGIPFNVTATNGSGYWSALVNVSGLVEGTHTVTAIANDSSGNINNTEQRTFTLDKTAPMVSWINPTNYSNYTKNTFNIIFNASVLDLSAQSVLFSFDNASGTNFNVTAINGSGYWAAQYNVSSLAEGNHIVTIIANDTVGNINNLQTIIFTVDNTAPTVSWINPTNGSNFTRLSYNQTFNASISELNFVQAVLFSFDNASGTNFNVTAINGSGTWAAQYNVSSLAEGTHFVNVIANDSAGNMNNTQQITFTTDFTAPIVSWINPTNGSNYTRTAYNQTFNISLLEMNAQSVLFSFDNATGNKFNVTATNGSGYWSASVNVSGLKEGSHTVTVIANDSAGNINNNQQINFIVDFTVPAVVWTTPTNLQSFSATAYNQTFNLSISETNFVNRVLLSFNNATGISFNVTATNGSGYWSALVNVSGLMEGTHIVTAIANDSAGNINNTEQRTFTVDKTAPVVSWINPTNYSNYTKNTFNITFNASILDLSAQSVLFSFDNASGTNFNVTAINGSGSWAAQYNVSSLAEGTHTATVIANDSVGNINNLQTIIFTVDNTAPTVNWINPTNGSNFTRLSYNQTFNASISELNFVQAVLFSFDNASGNNFNITATNGSGYWGAQYNVSSLAEGTHFVNVIANDSAGNMNNTQQITFIVDNTAPRVTWITPANNSNYSKTAYNKTFNVSIFEENFVQSVLFSFDNASGTNFNVTAINGSGYWAAQYNISSLAEGVQTITAIANDSAGNRNNTQQITITTDFTAPTFSNAKNTSVGFKRYQNFTANITINENIIGLQHLLFSANVTGIWDNTTNFSISGLQYNASLNKNITLRKGSQVCWYYWANDSLGNKNQSAENCFTVINTQPVFNETLTDKSVTVSNDLSLKVNCTDVDDDTITYYDNTTLFEINALTGLISDTPVAAEAGSYSINITCGDGEENISQKFTYTITAVPVPPPTPAPSGGGGGGAAAAGCVKDTDCTINQYCLDSICYDYECTSNKQCEKDKYCVAHQCLKIFDLKILQVDSPVKPGEFLDFSYFMKGMANISGDVTLNFWLEKGIEKATSGTDVIFMGNFEEKIEEGELFLPSTIEEGKYKFNVKLTFDGYEIISSRLVEVLKETPLLVSFTILDLPKIEVNKPWDYSAILSVNKDEPLPLNLKQRITKSNEEVWFKESNLILEKSVIIKEKVPGLESGEYSLELEAIYADKTVSAKQSFTVGEPKVGAIAGAATGGITEWARKSWPVLVGLFFVILISILISTLMRKREEEPSSERLELWVNKMNKLGKSKEEIRLLVADTGWSDQDLEAVFKKMEKTQEIKTGFNLSDEELKNLGDYIYAQHSHGAVKEEVQKQLLEVGWPKKVVDKFLAVYYE